MSEVKSWAGRQIVTHPGYPIYTKIRECGGRVITLLREVEELAEYHNITDRHPKGHYKECVYAKDGGDKGPLIPCVCVMIVSRLREALEILEVYYSSRESDGES